MAPAPALRNEYVAALERQRLKLQGHGRPIIAEKIQGKRAVTVGGIRYRSEKWKTFHDFLGFYIHEVLKGDWAPDEWKKPRAERHPLLNWSEDVNGAKKPAAQVPGITIKPMSSLSAAYLGLSYNLYLISHNNGKVHELLVRRLQHHDQFLGACYEVFVTGSMIRAGFDIELEDESDNTVSHCEFTATYRRTGQKYSVEAKMRHSQAMPPKVDHLLIGALKKRALHPRIVFIELNCLGDGTPDGVKEIVRAVASDLKSRETLFTIKGQPAPPAYLFITNNPVGDEKTPHVYAGSMDAFLMPDFTPKSGPLAEALAWRERHRGVLELSESLEIHNRIPATFDGELPEFAFSESRKPRLIVGSRLAVPTPDGEVVGELMSGAVDPSRKAAMCALKLDNGKNVMVECPLSDTEMAAYQSSPETFFGVITGPSEPVDHPFKFYDWIYETYRHNSKEHLLTHLMKDDPDLERLKTLPHEEIVKLFAERATNGMLQLPKTPGGVQHPPR